MTCIWFLIALVLRISTLNNSSQKTITSTPAISMAGVFLFVHTLNLMYK